MSLIEPIGNIHDQYGNMIRRKETGKIEGKYFISSQFKGKHVDLKFKSKKEHTIRQLNRNEKELAKSIATDPRRIHVYGKYTDEFIRNEEFNWMKSEILEQREDRHANMREKIRKTKAKLQRNPDDINLRRKLKEQQMEMVKLIKELKKSGGLKKEVSKSEFEKARIDLKSMINR